MICSKQTEEKGGKYMSYKKLLAQRDNLTEENQKLQIEFNEKCLNTKINDVIASIKDRTRERGGKYGQLIYHPEYRSKWKGTFFDTQRPLIESLKAYPLNRIELFKEGYKDNPYANPMDERLGELIGYCDMVAPSKYGPVIRITDPFGSYTFPPLKKTPFEEAIKWVGRILIVDALFQYGHKSPVVSRVQVLSFTLYEDLRKIV
jgi:hypothetical protein